METFTIPYILLAVQRALLSVVTPKLRAVLIDLNQEERIFYASVYYDGEISEKLVDLWECAMSEAGADLGICHTEEYTIKRLDYPQEIPAGGHYAYLRKEGPLSMDLFLMEGTFSPMREIVDFQENIGFFIDPVFEQKISTRWGGGTSGTMGSPDHSSKANIQ